MALNRLFGTRSCPSLVISWIPLVFLLLTLISVIAVSGADAVSEIGPWILLGASALALCLSAVGKVVSRRGIVLGMFRSGAQILPAVPILVCIAMVATSWMLSGVVPTLIYYGLEILSPRLFLVITCAVCSVISVLTGSSWTTIATIGVAFMGIGEVMGYSDPWIAGAIISGAYFGDKVSPLSDTTVVASSTAGVELFKHIRYLTYTTVPAMLISLGVFFCAGMFSHPGGSVDSAEMLMALDSTFNITAWTLVIPVVTLLLIVLRVPTLIVLFVAAMLGAAGIFILQPGLGMEFLSVVSTLWGGSSLATGNEALDTLVSTGGILGMLPTIYLVLSAMVFGAVMIGTGMLARITDSLTSSLHNRTGIVSATVGSGLAMNCCTADQYLSLIITGNMYRSVYRRFGLEPRLLGRSMEDSISVTSVLIPWNSCGVTQATVLGVSTLAYFPYCIFNILTPIMSIIVARIGYKIPQMRLSA
ncbi:MAG: sodium:proton antiporter [Muribaculaceae bacterium]|nr:sodium:proton antiporter [Muribaculaceae bacterium]